jgi:predicted SprT family Zn-dependent metalloprotease
MPYTPINVHLYRCNECHAVQALKLRSDRDREGKTEPPYDCACGGSGWTRIKVVG